MATAKKASEKNERSREISETSLVANFLIQKYFWKKTFGKKPQPTKEELQRKVLTDEQITNFIANSI